MVTQPIDFQLHKSPIQPAEAHLPRLYVTEGLSQTIGETANETLGEQCRLLSQMVQIDPSHSPSSQSAILMGNPWELPEMAAIQGYHPQGEIDYLSSMCHTIFLTLARGWPVPLQILALSTAIHRDTLPWMTILLPQGAQLVLNGQHPMALTRSTLHNNMFHHPDNMHHQTLPRPNDIKPLQKNHASTFFDGSLWNNPDGTMPAGVALFEASHYANFARLQKWMTDNKAKSEGSRDAAFTRHVVLEADGTCKIDFGFATLFMELSACFAKWVYFDMLSNILPSDVHVANQTISSLVKAVGYITSPIYRTYFEQARITIPDFTDPRAIVTKVPKIITEIMSLVAAK